MSLSVATTQHVTNASGTIAIASTSTSISVASVISEAPVDAHNLVDIANQVITTADVIGICAIIVLTLSFIHTVVVTRKRKLEHAVRVYQDQQFYNLRLKEYELEREKFQAEHKD